MNMMASVQMDRLTDRARRVGAIAAEHASAVDLENRFPSEGVAALKHERLLGAMVPEALGGDGAALEEIAELCAILGQYCSATAMIFSMHMIKLSSVIAHGRDDIWHSGFLRRIADEQLLLGSSTTESGSGDLRTSVCAIVRDNDSVTLEKDATCISYGAHCDAILVTARSHPDAAPSDQVLLVALKDQYTLTKTSDWNALGMRGTRSEGFQFSVRAPAEQILPKPFAEIAAQSMLAHCHLLWGALWYGVATEAFHRAQTFTKQLVRRTPNGQSPALMRLAELAITLQEMRAVVRDGLQRHRAAEENEAHSIGYLAAMNGVKVSASNLLVKAVEQALLICGLPGYLTETPFSMARLLRDAHSSRVMISNDRILMNSSSLLLMGRQDATLLG